MRITIEATVQAPVEDVWRCWTTPEHIRQWNAASAEWHCPGAEHDLRPGGRFSYRMEAKDGSMGFDFAGTFTEVVEHELIVFAMEDERSVRVEFLPRGEAVIVREAFDAESELAAEQQRQGWQAILDRFANYVAEEAA